MAVSDLELKELNKLQGWPHELAQEVLTAREHCPALEAEVKRLYAENETLKRMLGIHAAQEVMLIDERRQLQHDLEIAQLTLRDVVATVQRLVAREEEYREKGYIE